MQFPSVVVPVLDSIDALSKEVHQLLEGMREKERAPALFKDLEVGLTCRTAASHPPQFRFIINK